jgi:hypothetical protein
LNDYPHDLGLAPLQLCAQFLKSLLSGFVLGQQRSSLFLRVNSRRDLSRSRGALALRVCAGMYEIHTQ